MFYCCTFLNKKTIKKKNKNKNLQQSLAIMNMNLQDIQQDIQKLTVQQNQIQAQQLQAQQLMHAQHMANMLNQVVNNKNRSS